MAVLRLFFLDIGGDRNVNRVADAHGCRTFQHVRIECSLGSVPSSLGNSKVVFDAYAGNSDDAVDVLDVAFDFAPHLVRMIGNLANCQGP